jgi:uncharacterized coiled-coil DUF342 family protein
VNNLELDVGGTKIKGVWLAILLSFSSTIGGGIWAASEFFSRLETLEKSVVSARSQSTEVRSGFVELEEGMLKTLAEYNTKIATVSQQLSDNNVSELQGKLSEFSTNLVNISEQQKSLLTLRELVSGLDKMVAENNLIVQQSAKDYNNYTQEMNLLKTEVDDLWKGLDAATNPLAQ